MSKYYVTTPIYYINGLPHIGHVFTTVLTDVISRYQRLLGKDVFFLTGTDEHGQKAEKAARELGISPGEMADRIAKPFREAWDRLKISYSDFIRTTEERHYRAVKEIFRTSLNNGDIYLGNYEGWYCTYDEAFWTDGQLVNGNCPDCGRKVERVQEESYFFRLSKYQEPLLKFYAENPDFVVPRSRMNEVISFVERGLKDLSVSRVKLKWGIPVPDNPDHVIYVWYDALTNYLTGVGYPNNQDLFRRYWPADLHVIGKDILRFHAVYWPAFLLSAGIPLPRQILVHGWWLREDTKISKSRGNVVDPEWLMQTFGVDGLRYFLTREAPIEADSNYSPEGILKRVNSDLANDLGNLVSRTFAMVERYSQGCIPAPNPDVPTPFREALEKRIQSLPDFVQNFAFPEFLADIFEIVGQLNRYIVEQQPWVLAKDPKAKSRLNGVLYNTCEGIRILAALLAPVVPDSSDRIWQQLGLRKKASTAQTEDLQWGLLKEGTALGKLGPVFPRIELTAESSPQQPPKQETSAPEASELVSIEDFQKLGLKVGEVKAAEKIVGSKKLIRMEVDLGTETRILVAGIADAYSPEALIGKQVVVVTNLKPVKLMGVESRGMVLAASIDGKPVLITVADRVPNGTPVK